MADDRYHIDQSRQEAGKRILDMTDEVGFGAYAAGWIHDIPTSSWRYLMSTPMLKSKGSLWIYRRLLTVFRHTPLPEGVSPLDIFVIDPDLEMALFGSNVFLDEASRVLKGVTNPQLSGIIFAINHDIRIENFAVTDGFVSFYRRLSPKLRKRLRDPIQTFDHRVKMLEAA